MNNSVASGDAGFPELSARPLSRLTRSGAWLLVRPNAGVDDWPRTKRLLPWAIAAFMAMIFLAPVDHMALPISLPVDSTPDRVALPMIALLWLLAAATGAIRVPTIPLRVIGPMVLFGGVALASILANAEVLHNLAEMDLAQKKLALLFSYFGFFLLVATIVRPSEVWAFGTFIVVLGCILAAGVTWEYRTDFNPFFEWWRDLLPSSISISGQPVDDQTGRRAITGPTGHGLAAAAMLAMALPFAIVGLLRSGLDRNRKVLWALATAVILTGGIATLRKSGAVVPAAALLVLFLYRPRRMFSLLPLGVAILLFIQGMAPGALVNVKAQLVPSRINNESTQGRTEDYEAVKPDVRKHLALGRGYGSYDPFSYRYIDNEYLKRLVETGFVGTAAYLLLIVAVVSAAHRIVRRARDPAWRSVGLGVAAAAVAYGVAGALFDELFFPQAPYTFFFVAGLAAVVSRASIGARVPRLSPARLAPDASPRPCAE